MQGTTLAAASPHDSQGRGGEGQRAKAGGQARLGVALCCAALGTGGLAGWPRSGGVGQETKLGAAWHGVMLAAAVPLAWLAGRGEGRRPDGRGRRLEASRQPRCA